MLPSFNTAQYLSTECPLFVWNTFNIFYMIIFAVSKLPMRMNIKHKDILYANERIVNRFSFILGKIFDDMYTCFPNHVPSMCYQQENSCLA